MKIRVNKNLKFDFITDDSKQCDSKSAFVQTAQNGKYLQDAINNGASEVIDVAQTLALLGIDKNIKIIGITGTNGKTTTAAAIYSILLDLGKKVGFQGTRGCFINDKLYEEKSLTTPAILQTIEHLYQAINEGCEYFVMEVSSHALVQKRIEGLNFALKVFTNVTQDHLDFHKTLDAYIAVKSSFFSDETPKLINKDSQKIRFNRKNCMTYGADNPSTYKVAAYSLRDGISGVIQKFDQMCDFQSSLHGLFNLYNLVAAIAAVDMLGVAPLPEICDVVQNFAGVAGRMEVVSEDPLIIVDFAHTPDGIDKVLDSLKEKKMLVVFGAGGDRDRDKRAKMGYIVSHYAKMLIVTSDNPRSENPDDIIKEIVSGCADAQSVHVQPDRKAAIAFAIENRKDDEIVVILGKGDETHQEIQGQKIPFDDRVVVRELLHT